MTSERYLNVSVVSLVCSWPRTGILAEPRALLSSVFKRGQTQLKLARRSTDVSAGNIPSPSLPYSDAGADGYGHLILRVEFAKRAT